MIAGVELRHIAGVAKVESTTLGPFDAAGNPTVLFERHKFSLYTEGRFDYTHVHLSHRAPGGYGTYASQWGRLEEARDLDDAAAVMSTSWGAFQVMGFNFRLCGFLTLEVFESCMRESAGQQLNAFAHYLKSRDLGPMLVAGEYERFARRYNGPDYAKNNYHVKLRKAIEEA
jgi:hypothetical protein